MQLLALANPLAAGALQIANLIALLLLVQAAIFRARRYRLSRTRWRGIRAGQDGSTWNYIATAVAYGLLTSVTLGIAVPWMRVALEGYVMNNTRFGDRHFRFDAKARKLLPIWLTFYGVVVAALVAVGFIVIPGLIHLAPHRNPQDPSVLAAGRASWPAISSSSWLSALARSSIASPNSVISPVVPASATFVSARPRGVGGSC